jgi:hypothetical protein
VNGTGFFAMRVRPTQARKPGTGESVTKVSSDGHSRLSSSTTCLMRKLPNDTPRRPSWQLEME